MIQGGGSVHASQILRACCAQEVLRACGAQDDRLALVDLGKKKRGKRRPVGGGRDYEPGRPKTMTVSRLKPTMLIDDAHVLGVHHGKSLARVIHRRDE